MSKLIHVPSQNGDGYMTGYEVFLNCIGLLLSVVGAIGSVSFTDFAGHNDSILLLERIKRRFPLSSPVDCGCACCLIFWFTVKSALAIVRRRGFPIRYCRYGVATQALAFVDHARHLPCAIIMRDRDGKFTAAFDQVFKGRSIQVKPVSPQATNLNAFVERWIQSLQHEASTIS